MGELLAPSHLLLLLPIAAIGLLINIPPYWMIFKKAGFSPWLSLLMALPLVKWIVLWVVGFSDWRPGAARLF